TAHEMEAAPLEPFSAAATQPAPDAPADTEKITAPAAAEDAPQVAAITTPPLAHDGWPPLDALDETAALPAQRKRKPSGLWIAGILLLTLLLAGQGVYDYRTDLARDYPTLKPALQQLCALIGCDLPLPRRIDQVSIEASTLQTDPARPQLFILHATLRNRAAYVMAYPSLDLSLTDIQDKVVVRRVLSPAAYLPKTTDPAAGMAASSDAAITLYLKKTAGLHAAGYRLALFYPHELPPIRRQVIVTPP
ncbi:MAG TPA: hypothetical protein DEP05_08415, partial [Betaproteobacteria bacterium]|nr:hypothetical protein [Betaproteobacteria bacterium]